MIDRKSAPSFQRLEKVHIPKVHSTHLSNGRKVFYLLNDNTRVFKIELVIKAGSWYSKDYHTVPLTLKMLNEGTQKKSGKELSEAFDRLGSFTEFSPGFDNSSIGLYGLTKYFEQNIEELSELITTPVFDSHSFASLQKREAQKLRLNMEKSNYKASSSFRNNLFGSSSPYGVIPDANLIESLDINFIRNFYESNFTDFDLFISGNVPDNFIGTLDQYLGQGEITKASSVSSIHNTPHTTEPRLEERNSKFIQSSIRAGRRLFNRSHADYRDFMVLNEVLGGYFGSRLMKNIREDKGYTYGIYSQLYALNHAGYFAISTDVDSENEAQTLEEIYSEISTLRTVIVSDDELTTVKNYMAGTFAGSLGSPFSIMDKFKAVHYQGLNLDFFESYISSTHNVSSERLLYLANQYLQDQDFSISIVGS